MTLKLLTGLTGMLLFLAFMPNAFSQEYNDDLDDMKLYFYLDNDQPFLKYGYDYESYYLDTVELYSGENATLSIHDVKDRVFNQDLDIRISLDTGYTYSYIELYFQLRFDGNGDGNFEYVVDFPMTQVDYYDPMIVEPSSTTGVPVDMNGGTIELEISMTDNSYGTLTIECDYDTYVQVPFDIDTDRDGIGDHSDSDDDNDGHPDSKDEFPKDRKEWKDTDGDGIGDNADLDDNDNGIPDDFELPLVIGIILMPFVIISIIRKRLKKKSGGGKAGGEEEIEPLTTSKSGPKNW